MMKLSLKILLLFTVLFNLSYAKEKNRKLAVNYQNEYNCFKKYKGLGLDLREIYKIGCESNQVAQKILENKQVVPKVIYHWGKKKYMLQNIENGNISKDAWDKYIMGDITRYGLGKIRKGFYGTSTIIYNGFASESYNWINEIHIKEECRKPKNVISLVSLYKNSRFIKWAKMNAVDLNFYKQECFSKAGGDPKMRYKGHFTNSKCEKITFNFLKESDVKVIQDHVIKTAWYIRDRNCISDIRGNPKDIMEILSNRGILWQNVCSNLRSNSNRHLARVFLTSLKSLIKDGKLDLATKQKINSQVNESNFETLKGYIVNILDAHSRCEKNNHMDTFLEAVDIESIQAICN